MNSFRTYLSRVMLLVIVLLVCSVPFASASSAAQATRVVLPTNTPRVSITPLPATITLTPSRTLRPSRTPTATRTATITRTPSFTPTPIPTLVIMGTYQTPVNTPVTMIPPAAATPVKSADDIVTVMLLGSDTITAGAVARTDVIILLSIDRTTQSVSMMHIPRDMFVYVPNDTMEKINTVVNLGNKLYGDGGGIKLMKETLMYNYGIKIDFYARVDFVTFQAIVGKLGGLDLSVDCALQDWKLISPDLDYNDPKSWEPYTLNIGRHLLDPYTALWYVRSRITSDDLDRGRRQMEVLRAMWRQAKTQGLFGQIASLWPQAEELVDTDLTLPDILGLAPTALSISPENVQQIVLAQGTHFTPWYTADTGSFVFLPNADGWKTAVQNFMLPPSKNRLGGENPTVEVGAQLSVKGFEQVVADRLSWEGFNVTILPTESMIRRDSTVLIDYTGNSSPNSLKTIMKDLRITEASVISKPDPNRTVDFRIEMGPDYGSSCFYGLPADSQPTPQE